MWHRGEHHHGRSLGSRPRRMAWALSLGLAMLAGSALAHDAIGVRRKIMKAMGAATKDVTEMMRGNRPWDAAKAAAGMRLVANSWPELAHLFPAGSHAGGNTRAAPEIWSSLADFMQQGEAMAATAARAADAAVQGEAAFRPLFEEASAACKGCHRGYMIRE
jgi:cytochrome c556